MLPIIESHSEEAPFYNKYILLMLLIHKKEEEEEKEGELC